jgi:hypothetical protein
LFQLGFGAPKAREQDRSSCSAGLSAEFTIFELKKEPMSASAGRDGQPAQRSKDHFNVGCQRKEECY